MKDKSIEELKQIMNRRAKDILRIIASAPTPEMRHELATMGLEWIKKMTKESK